MTGFYMSNMVIFTSRCAHNYLALTLPHIKCYSSLLLTVTYEMQVLMPYATDSLLIAVGIILCAREGVLITRLHRSFANTLVPGSVL